MAASFSGFLIAPMLSARSTLAPSLMIDEPCRHGAPSAESAFVLNVVSAPASCSRDRPPTKKLAILAMSPEHPNDGMVHTIFYLPTELVTSVAVYLCDKDLYTLTRVSHRMASIACPLYFVRKGLVSSLPTNTLSLRGEGFKALDIWLRSPGFSVIRRLACSFSFHPQCAITQMKYLRKCLDLLPLQLRSFFLYVRLTHIDVGSLEDLLGLLLDTAFLTGCLDLTMSGVTYQDTPQHISVSHISRRRKKRSAADIVFLEFLQCLRLTRFNLTSSQWANFLSCLCIPSLRTLEVWGASSGVAIFKFLLQHSNIRELRFVGCSWMDTPLSSHRLKLQLPFLHTLQGSLYQVLFLLRSISSPPVLRNLMIEADPPARAQCNPFFDQVVDVLTMCKGSFSLDILLAKEEYMAELTLADARALAACKRRSNPLPFVNSLRIGFNSMDDVTPIYCELWMALFPHLRQARLYTVELNTSFGALFRRQDDILEIVWDPDTS